jgi:hypothetical protein
LQRQLGVGSREAGHEEVWDIMVQAAQRISVHDVTVPRVVEA